MSMEIVYVRTCVGACVHVRPPHCACANGVRILLTLLVLEVLQLFVSVPGNVPNTARKRPSEETGTTQATGAAAAGRRIGR